MKKFQFKTLFKNPKTRKIVIGCLIGVAVLAIIIAIAVYMDGSNVRLVNSNTEAGRLLGGGRVSSGSKTTIRAQANPGYVFVNWTNEDGSIASEERDHEIVVPESDITLTANWKLSVWEVSLVLNSTTNTTVYPKTAEIDEETGTVILNVTVKDDILFLNAPTKDGYTFLGWYKSDKFLEKEQAEDFIPSGTVSNITLYARWAPSYYITYDLGDAFASNNPENPDTYTEYANVDLKLPIFYERNAKGELTGGNYKFEGWYDENGVKVETIQASRKKDITLTAHWDKNELVFYTVYTRNGVTYVDIGRCPQHILEDKHKIANLKAGIADGSLTPDPKTGFYSLENTFYAKVTAAPYQNDAKSYHSQFSDGTDVKKGEDFFFIVEPITWRVVSGDPNDPKSEVFLLAESVLTSGAYHTAQSVRSYNGKAVYANNWQYSNIRAYLNGAFMDMAFMPGEAAFVLTTSVDFGTATSHHTRYANGKPCDDKIFLLSYADTANRAFGWNHWTINEDPLKVGKATDYAKAMGVYASLNGGKEHDAAHWWLRSPGDKENRASVVTALGTVGTYDIDCTAIGIRPALKARFTNAKG